MAEDEMPEVEQLGLRDRYGATRALLTQDDVL